jgi:hypothetical protein
MCLSPFPNCPDSANVSPRARRTARIILKGAAPAPWQGHWKQLSVSAPRPSSRPLQRARSGRGLSRQHYGPRARHLRRRGGKGSAPARRRCHWRIDRAGSHYRSHARFTRCCSRCRNPFWRRFSGGNPNFEETLTGTIGLKRLRP